MTSVIALAGLIIVIRLYYLQVYAGEIFRETANSQYEGSIVNNPYDRGFIYLRAKSGEQITAAGLASGYILAINPRLTKNPDFLYAVLKPYLSINREQFMAKANKQNDPYEEIEKRLAPTIASKISDLNLEGVYLVRQHWRVYPGGKFMANVLGFVGYNNYAFGGQYGVERYYDNNLIREDKSTYQNFISDVLSIVPGDMFNRESARAADITLSLEPKVQLRMESKLDEIVNKWKPTVAGILVIDPTSGKIFAMASSPSFNPNHYAEASSTRAYANPFVDEVYELGSIMKPITMSSALDAGTVTASSTYFDTGTLEIDGKKISDYDKKPRGIQTMQDVLKHSLNLGSVHVMRSLGRERYHDYLLKFGFGDKTGIDLPNETHNLMDNLEGGREVEYATASFGQGIALSPISMVRALSALANGGYLIKPHVTGSLNYQFGQVKEIQTIEQGRAISKTASEEVTRMLVEVVDTTLAGGKIKMPHYRIAAKTGTAQIANSATGEYYTDKFLHSFFGYFPAYNPRFLVFLFMREPKGAQYASETLALPFRDIAQFLINYYDIPPDR